MLLPIADDHSFGIVAKMTRKADIAARIVVICYTLVIVAMAWFTFAFCGFGLGGDVGGSIVFALIALFPIPVCILCFRREEVSSPTAFLSIPDIPITPNCGRSKLRRNLMARDGPHQISHVLVAGQSVGDHECATIADHDE